MTDVDSGNDQASPPAVNPYLVGNYAPVSVELTVETPLPIDGALPPVLEGLLVRNGPNPAVVPDPARYHWFSGDGMVHAIELRGGRAVSYRNRYVRTRKLPPRSGHPASRGPRQPIDGTGQHPRDLARRPPPGPGRERPPPPH